MGEEVEFSYKWDKKDCVSYCEELREFVLDYGVVGREEEMEEKGNGIG